MANTKTAKENIKINERNRRRNLHYKTLLKSAIKRAKEAVSSKDDNRANIVFDTLKTIAKVAAKGIISKPTANRKKSSIHKALAASLEGKDLPKRSEEGNAKKAAPKKSVAKKTTKKEDAAPAKASKVEEAKESGTDTKAAEPKAKSTTAKTEKKAAPKAAKTESKPKKVAAKKDAATDAKDAG